MDIEIKNFIKVWISALASLTYCYFISLNIPKGKIRLISLLPIFYFLTILPSNLTTISLGGLTAFFLTWLANFKLLLLSFGQGPLSSTRSISLSHFISIACLPIKIKNKHAPFSQNTTSTSPTPKQPLNTKTKETQFLQTFPNLEKPLNTKTRDTPLPKTPTKAPKSPLNLAIKGLILALLTLAYEHKQHVHPNLMLVYYCFYMYLGLELVLTTVAAIAGALIGVEFEPTFDEPYLSTSLQDFWGRRWNRTASNILRPTVYEPIRLVSTKTLGTKWAPLPAVFSTFVVSGLMHELIFYYLARASPTWEVTMFFIVQGVCLVVEIVLKKVSKGRLRLHWVVSMPLTVGFVMVTGFWLFFPPLLRCNADVRASKEVWALLNFVTDMRGVYDWSMGVFSTHKI